MDNGNSSSTDEILEDVGNNASNPNQDLIIQSNANEVGGYGGGMVNDFGNTGLDASASPTGSVALTSDSDSTTVGQVLNKYKMTMSQFTALNSSINGGISFNQNTQIDAGSMYYVPEANYHEVNGRSAGGSSNKGREIFEGLMAASSSSDKKHDDSAGSNARGVDVAYLGSVKRSGPTMASVSLSDIPALKAPQPSSDHHNDPAPSSPSTPLAPSSPNPAALVHVAPASPGSSQPGLGMAPGTTPSTYGGSVVDTQPASGALVNGLTNLGGQKVEDVMAYYQESWAEFSADNKSLVAQYSLADTPSSVIPASAGDVYIRSDKYQEMGAYTAPGSVVGAPPSTSANPAPVAPSSNPTVAATVAPASPGQPGLGMAPGTTVAGYQAEFPGVHVDSTSGALVAPEVAPKDEPVSAVVDQSLAPIIGSNSGAWDEFSADNTEYKQNGVVSKGMSIEVRADDAGRFAWPSGGAAGANETPASPEDTIEGVSVPAKPRIKL